LLELELQKNTLSNEKEKFIQNMVQFIDSIDFQNKYEFGRPKVNSSDLFKSILIMSYHGMSYRRAESDIRLLFKNNLISSIPRRSTLNKYMNLTATQKMLEAFITISALVFIDHEDTLICDSTWLSHHMYGGGYKIVYDKQHAPLDKCTKIHIGCLKNSKVIASAIVTKGTSHDSPIFQKLLMKVLNAGFCIRSLLADCGYASKDNYSLCSKLNIEDVFIDFQDRSKPNPNSHTAWNKRLRARLQHPELWHENYRFRVLVESLFSCIKKKSANYLRSRKEIARFNELLLKALVYNINVIGRYF
ncbi:MAG: transposase, partial [archaeon]|nr:transposase [archaeon]